MGTNGGIARLSSRVVASAELPVGSVDVLPMLAAAASPDGIALRSGITTVTFAELDRRISRLAAGIRDLIGGEGSVVALSSVLTVEFPVAYYAIARSGNVVAPVNPRLDAEVLRRLLESAGARAAVLDRTMYGRMRPILATLPDIEQVLVLDGPARTRSVLTCAELAARGDLLVDPRDRDENQLGAMLLGGGSRGGYPPTAGLSHRGLKAAAARIGAAHGLSEHSVVLNALPSYHHGDLDAGLLAGACQVLANGKPGRPDLVVLDRRNWPAAPQRRAVAS